MSTISASTTSTTAYKVTADTTGTLVLQTGSTPTTAVTIDTAQKVGINTGSPQNLLNVVKDSGYSSAAANAGLALQSDSGATYTAGLHFGTDKTNTLSYIQSDSSASYSAVPLAINPLGGNVGIGTSSPTNPLELARAPANASNQIFVYAARTTGASSGYGDYYATPDGLFGRKYLSSTSWCASVIGTNAILFNTGSLGSETERARITSSGNLLVGATSGGGYSSCAMTLSTNSGTTKWDVGPYATATNFLISSGTGGVVLSGTATSWSAVSDARSKTELTPFENAAQKVCTLRAGTGRYLTDEEQVSRSFLIAQDVLAVLPEAVDVSDDEQQSLMLRYTDLIPLLTAAIQELNAKVEAQAAEIATLKGQA